MMLYAMVKGAGLGGSWVFISVPSLIWTQGRLLFAGALVMVVVVNVVVDVVVVVVAIIIIVVVVYSQHRIITLAQKQSSRVTLPRKF